jgi:hypothetical protein
MPKSEDEREHPLVLLNSGCGLADHVNDEVGLGEHDDVTAVRLDGGRPHAFRRCIGADRQTWADLLQPLLQLLLRQAVPGGRNARR